jgi:hypothetical protein
MAPVTESIALAAKAVALTAVGTWNVTRRALRYDCTAILGGDGRAEAAGADAGADIGAAAAYCARKGYIAVIRV